MLGEAVDHVVCAVAEGSGEVYDAEGVEGGVVGVGFHPLVCAPWFSAEEDGVVAVGGECGGDGEVCVADEAGVDVGYGCGGGQLG